MIRAVLIALGLLLAPMVAGACDGPVAVCDGADSDHFALVRNGVPATVYVETMAEKPVLRVAEDFADDLQRVSGTRPAVVHSLDGVKGDVVLITELGHTGAELGDETAIAGKWEAYQQSVGRLPDGRHMLTITGADARGAIYGTYDISARMGVSPWYWWADVPVAHKDNLYITDGVRTDAPVVKYRGFFINDEEPAFGGWAREKFGGINHQLYAKVFELDLRLKGNYLWPAMWGKSIADDDPESLNTASDYGIVLGTSHHEPMTRAQDEWHRHQDQGVTGGAWDYTKNADNLRKFWRGGIERMVQGHHENVVTVGMRGDGDEPMTEGTATQLLETVVADQRKIIADVTGEPADRTPQVWALYKEVQAYYDHGMKVPDDVTLLFSDDNWGNIRRLPDPKAAPRSGGYGIYYHFDYVGGPRNYKWINTNQIEKTWQQMDLAYESGADRLWIVNVGDIKPMEYPLSFFMDMAWNPKAMTPEALKAYPAQWAAQQFGPEHAQDIGDILTRYSQYNARRKPELLETDKFSLDDWRGFAFDYAGVLYNANQVKAVLPKAYENAYYELVGYPVAASANLVEMYDLIASNHDPRDSDDQADSTAALARQDFDKDSQLAAIYNSLADGKWNHMMDQTHIGYTNWQEPAKQTLPHLRETGAAVQLPDHPYISVIASDPNWAAHSPRIDPAAGVTNDGIWPPKHYISIEAEHFARQFDGGDVHWQIISSLGRTLSSVISLPQTAPATTVADNIRLDYKVVLTNGGDALLKLYLAPTLDTGNKGGLRIGVTIDQRPVRILNFDLQPDTLQWNTSVEDNIIMLAAPFKGLKRGAHTIRIYRIDGNIVLEKLLLDMGDAPLSYLGPDESLSVNQLHMAPVFTPPSSIVP